MNDRTLRPENDPFYYPPLGFDRLESGAIMRSRRVELALFGRIPQRVDAWQLLYRTCDLNGIAQAAVTTVILPAGEPVGRRPLLSYQCAIDAVTSTCFPSYALRRGARVFGSLAQFEFTLVANLLERGWAVSIPDHEGPAGCFAVAREPGYRILDGIRAAQAFSPLGLRNAQVGLWGYSGGGMATSWAAEMAPEYAPELDIVGVAVGSSVADPGAVFRNINGTFFSGLPTLALCGLRRAYPEFDEVIREHVDRKGLALLAKADKTPTVPTVLRLMRHDLGKHADIPLDELLALPEMKSVFEDIRLGSRTPTAPMFVVQAVHDQIIAADLVDRQVADYRAAGVHITYRRDRLSEHALLSILATPTTLDWLADRFAGLPLPVADTRTVWSMAFSPAALRGLVTVGLGALKMFAGLPLGRSRATVADRSKADLAA